MNILKGCLNQVGKANKVSSTTNKLCTTHTMGGAF